MKKKVLVSFLVLASGIFFVPMESYAGTNSPLALTAAELDPQIRVRIGNNRRSRRWNNRRNRRWNNRQRNRSYRSRNRAHVVRQVYYVNGRRNVRRVRVRY